MLISDWKFSKYLSGPPERMNTGGLQGAHYARHISNCPPGLSDLWIGQKSMDPLIDII